MAGETAKTEAVCLAVLPWSRTSHVVRWLSPSGVVATSAKGAARPKSAFLGQYDLNYTCEIVHYLSARGDLHALRECSPVALREELRRDWRSLLAAEHMREVAGSLCPQGPDAADWFALLERSLDSLCGGRPALSAIVGFETEALRLAGLDPAAEALDGAFRLRGGRAYRVSPEAARCIASGGAGDDARILLDAAGAIGVFYSFHLEGLPTTRRAALRAAATQKGK